MTTKNNPLKLSILQTNSKQAQKMIDQLSENGLQAYKVIKNNEMIRVKRTLNNLYEAKEFLEISIRENEKEMMDLEEILQNIHIKEVITGIKKTAKIIELKG